MEIRILFLLLWIQACSAYLSPGYPGYHVTGSLPSTGTAYDAHATSPLMGPIGSPLVTGSTYNEAVFPKQTFYPDASHVNPAAYPIDQAPQPVYAAQQPVHTAPQVAQDPPEPVYSFPEPVVYNSNEIVSSHEDVLGYGDSIENNLGEQDSTNTNNNLYHGNSRYVVAGTADREINLEPVSKSVESDYASDYDNNADYSQNEPDSYDYDDSSTATSAYGLCYGTHCVNAQDEPTYKAGGGRRRRRRRNRRRKRKPGLHMLPIKNNYLHFEDDNYETLVVPYRPSQPRKMNNPYYNHHNSHNSNGNTIVVDIKSNGHSPKRRRQFKSIRQRHRPHKPQQQYQQQHQPHKPQQQYQQYKPQQQPQKPKQQYQPHKPQQQYQQQHQPQQQYQQQLHQPQQQYQPQHQPQQQYQQQHQPQQQYQPQPQYQPQHQPKPQHQPQQQYQQQHQPKPQYQPQQQYQPQHQPKQQYQLQQQYTPQHHQSGQFNIDLDLDNWHMHFPDQQNQKHRSYKYSAQIGRNLYETSVDADLHHHNELYINQGRNGGGRAGGGYRAGHNPNMITVDADLDHNNELYLNHGGGTGGGQYGGYQPKHRLNTGYYPPTQEVLDRVYAFSASNQDINSGYDTNGYVYGNY